MDWIHLAGQLLLTSSKEPAANSSRWTAGNLHRFTYPTPEKLAGQHHVATDREPAKKNNPLHIQSWWTGINLSEGS